ncbi:hypothetical protein Tco_0743485 [Tanacetum coccineum]
MTNKIDTVLKAIIDRIMGALPNDTVKNPKLNVNPTALVFSARSCPTEDPQCSTRIHSSINAITVCPKQPDRSQNNNPVGEEQEEKDDPENINTNPSSPPDPLVLFVIEKVRKLNSFLESLTLYDDSHEEGPGVDVNAEAVELELVHLGLNKIVSFEVVCRDLNIVPTVTLFCVFQCPCKQGDWFSFSKCRNTEDICMDDGPSSLKKWKSKFFLIDRIAILDHLTWRHSHSCVSDDLPADGYDRNDVERLHVHLIRLREMREEVLVRSVLSSVWSNKECDPMSIYDFMTLPSWGDAKIVEEPHHLSEPLLERVPSHTTAPAAEKDLASPLVLSTACTTAFRVATPNDIPDLKPTSWSYLG